MTDFQGKKVAILGYGVNNAELVPFLQERGASVTVLDKNEGLANELTSVDHRLGEHYLDSLTDFEIIFRTPGIPYLTPQIQAAQAAGVLVTSQTQLFLELCPARTIGVTGTKGKGTTSSLIKTILETAHLHGDIPGNVYLAGNIGASPIRLLDRLQSEDWVILELSSFQTQDLSRSPHIAVILTVTQDHLDHHQSLEEYHEAKRNLVRHQTGDDYVVINYDSSVAMGFLDITSAQPYFYSGKEVVSPGAYVQDNAIIFNVPLENKTKIMSADELMIRGQHNLENVAAASVAAHLAGASTESIRMGARYFEGLPLRLERVGEKNGITYYNDSFATQPDATIVAIQSFTEPITLIVGGSSKGADFTDLIKTIENSSVQAVVCIGEEGKKIKMLLDSIPSKTKVIEGKNTMREIVVQATEATPAGGVVLLSPGCASKDMFKDYKDRGKQFTEAVNDL